MLSIRVLYITSSELPQPSITFTVIIAAQSPTVLTAVVKVPIQLSEEVVAAVAAASAKATDA